MASALVARWRPHGLEIAFDPDAPPSSLTAEARAQLAADLAHVDAARLVRHYPRDAAGKLPLGEVVLLAEVAVAPPLRAPKGMWLVAASPAKRSAAQVITLALQPEFGRHAEHSWVSARWLWDTRAADAPEAVRWGSAKLPISELARGGAPGEIAKSAPRDARIAHAIRLVRAGRWREALEVCGVAHELDPLPYRKVNGKVIHRELWDAGVDAAMAAIAPWRLEAALIAYPARAYGLRLFNLPGQTVSRKYCVVLRSVNDAPHLSVGISGTNERLPAIAWQWPPDLVLALRGEAPPELAPAEVAAPSDHREEDLLAVIAASPDDDHPRQVYADLLAERGDARAELIRLQLAPASDARDARAQSSIRKHARGWLGPLGALVTIHTVQFARGFLSHVTLGSGTTPFDAWSGALTRRARLELAHVVQLGLGAGFPVDLAAELLAEPPPRLARLILGSPALVVAMSHAVPELEVYVAQPAEVATTWSALRAAKTSSLRIACERNYLGMLTNALRPLVADLVAPVDTLYAVSHDEERLVGTRRQ